MVTYVSRSITGKQLPNSVLVDRSSGTKNPRHVNTQNLNVRLGTCAEHLELAYQQVWLYAMRHYHLAKPTNENADETVV
ncbi:hypothetical protein V1505DRAFT_379389 [Lipomyces doorenjongii]